MHVKKGAHKARQTAVRTALLGMMAAFSVLLLVLGTVTVVNTLFLTAAAAFLAGIVVVLYGIGYGMGFYFVCGMLDFILNPNKMHVILYVVLAGYILCSEWIWNRLANIQEGRKKEWLHRGIRFLIFLAFYIPLLYFVPGLFVSTEWRQHSLFWPAAMCFGIIGWVVYDMAYAAFQKIMFTVIKKYGKNIWRKE